MHDVPLVLLDMLQLIALIWKNCIYNPDDETSFTLAAYANNLYGKATTEALPYGNFEWFKPSHITTDFIKDYDNDGEDCFF